MSNFDDILQNQAEFGLDTYKEDVDAINVYMKKTPAANAEASNAALEWATFWSAFNAAGWYDQRFSKDLWMRARDIRDRFNKANGHPVDAHALSAEQLGQDKPLGGALGDLPSNLADKGIMGIWKSMSFPAKAGTAAILGLIGYKVIK